MFQKFVLLYAIREDDAGKEATMSNMMEMFAVGSGIGSRPHVAPAATGRSPVRLRPGETLNMDFERHSRSAAETGKPALSPAMQKALHAAYMTKTSKPDFIVGAPNFNAPVKPDELG